MIGLLRFIEWICGYINRFFGFIATIAMIVFILVTFSISIFRELFLFTSSKLDDSAIILFATTFTFATGYTMLHHGHVRIDIFYANTTPRKRAWTNIFGSLFLGLPCTIYLFLKALPKAQYAYSLKLTSQYSDGLPFYWILKYFIVLAALLLILQIIALVCRSLLVLLGEPEAGAQFKKPVVAELDEGQL